MSNYIPLLAFENASKAKEVIARWILDKCDDSDKEGEIMCLLDKAYPHGAEESLHEDWVEVIVDHEEEQRWV